MVQQRVIVLILIVVLLSAGCFGVEAFASSDANDRLGFREVGSEAGLDYTASRNAAFGGGRTGVYVTDFNNDHRPDVLATGGDEPVLFENTGGAFKRTDALPPLDITVKGALAFDYDNDGWEDLLLLPIHGSAVFLENRNGRFHERAVGFDTEMQIAIGASAADYDRDGCLDVFIAQSGDWRRGVPKAGMLSYSREAGIENDNGHPNLLFDGDCGSFERVKDAGIEGTRWSLVTSFVDLNEDGYPDIHVGNDYNADVLYVNQQNGTFKSVELADTDRHAMASEVADVNGDGRLDVFTTNIHFETTIWMAENMPSMDNSGNNLLINQGNSTFVSQERAYGVRNGGWGWAAALVDLDNDGKRDLVHTTKYYRADATGDGIYQSVKTRPRIWRRTGVNFTRLNASKVGFETSSGRGLAHLDYDLDGDQDLVVANNNGAFKLYENRDGSGNWLQVAIEGNGASALGSQVYVTTGNRTQYQALHAKADFLSQDTRTLHFGLDQHETATVRIVWPDGTERTLESIGANQRIMIQRNGSVKSIAEGQNSTDDGS